jgi:hypothetical protein
MMHAHSFSCILAKRPFVGSHGAGALFTTCVHILDPLKTHD